MTFNAIAALAFAIFISQATACVHVYGDREEAAVSGSLGPPLVTLAVETGLRQLQGPYARSCYSKQLYAALVSDRDALQADIRLLACATGSLQAVQL
jgi:hypothetical protein